MGWWFGRMQTRCGLRSACAKRHGAGCSNNGCCSRHTNRATGRRRAAGSPRCSSSSSSSFEMGTRFNIIGAKLDAINARLDDLAQHHLEDVDARRSSVVAQGGLVFRRAVESKQRCSTSSSASLQLASKFMERQRSMTPRPLLPSRVSWTA